MDTQKLKEVIDGHVEAYNNHDVKKFGQFFAEHISMQRPSEEEIVLSHAELLQFYGILFKTFPKIKATILARQVDEAAGLVSDYEEVDFGDSSRGKVRFRVEYIVRDNLICSVKLVYSG